MFNTAHLRPGPGNAMRAATAILLTIFRDICKQRKIAECADHAQGLLDWQLGQLAIKLHQNCAAIGRRDAVKTDRKLANVLGFLEGAFARNRADGIAQKASQETHFFAQLGINRCSRWYVVRR